MRIGRRGLVATAILASISTWVVSTKTKGRSFSDIGELREVVMTVARAKTGVTNVAADPSDSARFTSVVGGMTVTSDVTNLFSFLSAYPDEDAEDAITRFVRSIPDAREPLIDDSRIVAVIRSRDYVEEARRTGVDLLHEPAGADLMIVYMADQPDSMTAIKVEDLPGKTVADVRAIALRNVREWLPKVVSDDSMGAGVLYYVDGNTLLSTSLVLVEEFWRSVAKRFPGDVLIALPRKDQLFVFDDDGSARTRALVRRLIAATVEDNFALLSPLLYARRGGRIILVSD